MLLLVYLTAGLNESLRIRRPATDVVSGDSPSLTTSRSQVEGSRRTLRSVLYSCRLRFAFVARVCVGRLSLTTTASNKSRDPPTSWWSSSSMELDLRVGWFRWGWCGGGGDLTADFVLRLRCCDDVFSGVLVEFGSVVQELVQKGEVLDLGARLTEGRFGAFCRRSRRPAVDLGSYATESMACRVRWASLEVPQSSASARRCFDPWCRGSSSACSRLVASAAAEAGDVRRWSTGNSP